MKITARDLVLLAWPLLCMGVLSFHSANLGYEEEIIQSLVPLLIAGYVMVFANFRMLNEKPFLGLYSAVGLGAFYFPLKVSIANWASPLYAILGLLTILVPAIVFVYFAAHCFAHGLDENL